MVPDTGHEKAIETHGAEFRERVLRFFVEVGGKRWMAPRVI